MKKPAHRRLFLLSIRERSANCRPALSSDLMRDPAKVKGNTSWAVFSVNNMLMFQFLLFP